ncbi:MAG: translocation/assembly module TamB domain-containing protein [Steroidobacteraceae bacterium]
MRRALRYAGWTLAAAVLLGLLVLGAVILAGNTRDGRRLIERETAELTAGRVRLSGLAGRFPAQITIARLQLGDARGVWMSAHDLSLHWSPLALLRGDLHIEALNAARIEVLRRPVSSGASGGGAALRLPDIDVDRVQIDTLVLEPPAAGQWTRLTMHGSVHYRSLQDAQVSLHLRRTNGQGLYGLTWQATPAAVTAALRLKEPAGGPLEHWLKVPGLGALRVRARLTGPRQAETLTFTARAGKLNAEIGGTIDLARRAADLVYTVTSPAMAPRAGLSWRHLDLTGRWRGPLSSAQASGVLELAGLRLTDGAALGALSAHLSADGRVLSVHASARGIRLPGPHPQLLQGSPLHLDASLQLRAAHRPLHVRLTDRLFDLSAQALTEGPRSATFTLLLRDLTALTAHDHLDVGGAVQLSGTLAQRGTKTRLVLHGAAQMTGASVLARLLGAHAQLALKASLTPARLDLERLVLTGHGVSASATGRAQRHRPGSAAGEWRSLHARWQVSCADLKRIWPLASGSVQLHGTVDGTPQALVFDVSAHSTLSVHGSKPGQIQATLRARGVPSALRAAVQARGTFDGAPLRFAATLARTAGRRLHFALRTAHWRSVELTGTLSSSARFKAARAEAQLRIGHLSDFKSLAGTALAGQLEANLTLLPHAGRQTLQLALTGRALTVGAVHGAFALSASGPIDALQTVVTAESPAVGGAAASLTATARLDGAARRLDLLRLSAQYRGQTLRLLTPARLTFVTGLRVSDLRLGLQRAVLAVHGELAPALDVRASLEHLDAGLVDAFVPDLLAQGTFGAALQLTGSRAAPIGRASFEISGLRFAGLAAQGLPALDAHGEARLHGGFAELSAALAAGHASRLSLSGRAPLAPTGALELKLTGTLDAALANAMLEARGDRAQGTLTVDAHIDGTARVPLIHGVVRLTKGDLRDYANGIHFSDVEARLVGDHGVLRIASLTARAGPGQLSAAGTIGVLQHGMPIDVVLHAHDIRPVTSDILTANLDTDLRVTGTLRHRLDLTGTIRILHAAISIPNGFPPNVATLKVIRPGESVRPVRRRRHLVIGLGLQLQAPQSIFVHGRGLDAQLGGALEIAGTTAQPRVSGGFTMTRGSFSLAGTRLNFTRGRVGFNGEGLRGQIDPTLDFVAQTTVLYTSTTTVTLRVSGFADAPKISLSSSPQLPQDDLLALLLFGKPASQLSPYELAETGASLASLSGIGGGGASRYNPLTWIRHTFGLNTLSVASTTSGTGAAGAGTTSGGTSVTAGKYLTNRVYVAATQTTQGSSQVRVDVILTPHLKLETRLGNGTATAQGTTPQNDPGSSIGLTYQVRY